MTTGAILLTGGTSRRLGIDKATLLLDGSTLSARAAAMLRRRGLRTIEVGPGHTDLPAVVEDPPGGGPLAALVAGSRALADGAGAPPDAIVLLACDLPHAGPAVDALLTAPPAALVVPIDASGHAQYVCARYDVDLVARAADLVAAGEQSLRALVATVPAGGLVELRGLPADALADIDTPADARRWGVELPR